MIDFLLLISVLFAGSRMAALSISEDTYKTIRNVTIITVLVGTLMILNSPSVAEVTSTIAKFLDSLGIGNPIAWRVKSSEFKSEIEGCYYLVLLGVIVFILFSTAFEHKGLELYREKNGVIKVLGLLIVLVIFYWIFFSESTLSAGVASRKIRHFYNSQFLLLGWEMMLLLAARDSGKALRSFFEKIRCY